jgi:uncharacterized protein YpmS
LESQLLQYRRVEKSLPSHITTTSRSQEVTQQLLDFDVDQQLVEKDRQRKLLCGKASIIPV